jgi:hypothetical protein
MATYREKRKASTGTRIIYIRRFLRKWPDKNLVDHFKFSIILTAIALIEISVTELVSSFRQQIPIIKNILDYTATTLLALSCINIILAAVTELLISAIKHLKDICQMLTSGKGTIRK